MKTMLHNNLARLAVLVVVGLCLTPVSAAPPQPSVVAEVQVLDAETLQPIAGAKLFTGPPAETGPDGIAKQTFPKDFRGQNFVAGGPLDYWLASCGNVVLHDSNALAVGALATDFCDPGAPVRAGLKPVPGRVIVFATPVCCLTWTGPQPEVRVLVLNGISGRPVKHVHVVAHMGQRRNFSGFTDRGGLFRIRLHEPIGRVIWAVVPGGWDYLGCSYASAMTEVVLKKGFVQHVLPHYCRPRGKWSEPDPQPGEFVIFVRHRSIWERLLDPWAS